MRSSINAQAPSGAMPIFLPVYDRPLSLLPADTPVPFSQILGAYATYDRQLATVLLVASTWQQVELGLETLPGACLPKAMGFLATAERDRLVQVLANHLQTITTREAFGRVHQLSPDLKRAAWDKLLPRQQEEMKRQFARFRGQ